MSEGWMKTTGRRSMVDDVMAGGAIGDKIRFLASLGENADAYTSASLLRTHM